MQAEQSDLTADAQRAGDQELLLQLWPKALSEVRRRCARTLSRLRVGEGGFYHADDFLQDLFIEFMELVRHWRAEPEPDEAELMAAWRRKLWGSGICVLRRTPQRLWTGVECAVEPGRLALDEGSLDRDGDGDHADSGLFLPRSALEELTQPEDAQTIGARLRVLDQLETALFRLRPLQRQVIFMSTFQALRAAEVALCLGLGGPNTVYQRLARARAALRRELSR